MKGKEIAGCLPDWRGSQDEAQCLVLVHEAELVEAVVGLHGLGEAAYDAARCHW